MFTIRNRDQLWQVVFVAVAATMVLALTVLLALRGGEDTSTDASGGLTVADDQLNANGSQPAGPSDADASDDGSASGLLDGGTAAPETSTSATTTTTPAPTTVASTMVAPGTEAPTTLAETPTSETTETTLAETPTSETTETPVTETTVTETSVTETSVTDTTVTETSVTETTVTVPETTTTLPVETVVPPTSEPPDNSAVRQSLVTARQRWAAAGIASYQMTVSRACFCLPGSGGPFEVMVRNGNVESITDLNGQGVSLDPQSITVPGLFSHIESALDAERLEVSFDPATGVPLQISIDRTLATVDDEVETLVTNFQVLQPEEEDDEEDEEDDD